MAIRDHHGLTPAIIGDMLDHDRLFKELLSTFFAEFIDLFLPQVAAYLDADSLVFLDKEVFTDVTAGERHEADLVVKARFKGADSFFLVHVETQAQSQRAFGARMFRYFARLHEKYEVPVYPIVIFSLAEMKQYEAEASKLAEPEREEMMQIVTSWMEEGIQKGLQQGKQEEALMLVMRQLQRRLGAVDATVLVRVQDLSLPQLEELSEALLDFTSLADLQTWLAANHSS